jgi:hypothetical protein
MIGRESPGAMQNTVGDPPLVFMVRGLTDRLVREAIDGVVLSN